MAGQILEGAPDVKPSTWSSRMLDASSKYSRAFRSGKSIVDTWAAGKAEDKKKRFLDTSGDANYPAQDTNVQGSFRKGGRVKKTGIYRLHKDEVVIPAEKARKLGRKSGRKSGRR